MGAVYLAISNLWTGDPRATAVSVLILALLLLGVHLAARALEVLPAEPLEHLSRAMLVAFILVLVFLLAEELTDHAIKRALFRPFRSVRMKDGAIAFDPLEGVVKLSAASVKWNLPALDFLLWPMLLVCALQVGWRQARWLQVVIAAATFTVTMLSDHKTSQVALMFALPAFAAAWWFPDRVRQALMALWIAAFLAAIPLAHGLFDARWHLGGRVGPTLAARIVLWNVTAKEFEKSPILGVGAAATKRLDNEREAASPAPTPPGFTYPLRTGPHAHDVFLQSWYELGAVGTLIFLVFGLTVMGATASAPRDTQPYLLAAAATVLVTSAASFGLFEPWFMGAYGMCALAISVAVAYRPHIDTGS
jgi:O-antigen ligase